LKKAFLFMLALVFVLCACKKEDNKEESKEESIDVFEYIGKLDEDMEQYIILGNYKGVSVNEVTVTDADVEGYKAELQKKYAYYKPLDKKKVETGDNVNISYTAYLNGVTFDGGSTSANLVVGDGDFDFPEIEQHLVGIEVGNTVSTNITVPSDYFSQGLRGKTLKLEITVNKIQEKDKTDATIDDAFVKEHFGLDSAKDFDAYAKKQLEKQAQDTMYTEAWKAALENCEIIKYPGDIVYRHVEAMYQHYKEEAAKYGAGVEIVIGTDVQTWRQDAIAYAEDYYKSEIAMYAILDREFGRDISDEEYKTRLEAYAKEEGISAAELEKKHGKDDIITSIYWDKVMEFVWENRVIA